MSKPIPYALAAFSISLSLSTAVMLFAAPEPLLSPRGLGAAVATLASTPVETDGGWLYFGALGRGVFLALFCTAVGVAAFSILFLRETPAPGARAARAAFAAAALLPVLGVSALSLQGLALEGGALADLWSRESIGRGVRTSLGQHVLFTIQGCALLALGVAMGGRLGGAASSVGAALALYGLAQTGHVAELAEWRLAEPALIAHVAIASFWIGGLWLLLARAPRMSGPVAAAFLERFSRVAQPLVILLIALGVLMASWLLGGVTPLLTTAYGWILLAKIGVVGLALLLALVNKTVVTRLYASEPSRAARLLQRNVTAELVLIGAALALTGALTKLDAPAQIQGLGAAAGGG